MSLLHTFLSRFSPAIAAYAGDEALMQAAVSAAANVIVADGEMSSEEFDAALVGMRTHAILEKGYDTLMLEGELYDAIGRARTRAGRVENLRRVAALAGRSIEQRQDVFLIAADVADQEGISEIESRALDEIAEALAVEKAGLLQTALARPMPSAAPLPDLPDRR